MGTGKETMSRIKSSEMSVSGSGKLPGKGYGEGGKSRICESGWCGITPLLMEASSGEEPEESVLSSVGYCRFLKVKHIAEQVQGLLGERSPHRGGETVSTPMEMSMAKTEGEKEEADPRE